MALRRFGMCRSSLRMFEASRPSDLMNWLSETTPKTASGGTMPPRRGVGALFTMIVLPASVDPLLKVRPLGANRGIQAMAGKNDGVVGEREQFRINGMENGGEIAAF